MTAPNFSGPTSVVHPVDASGASLPSGATGSPVAVQGNVASGATDSGNPVKVGGVFRTTKPTLTDGQRGDVQLTSNSLMAVGIVGTGGAGLATETAQGATDAQNAAAVGVRNVSFGLGFRNTFINSCDIFCNLSIRSSHFRFGIADLCTNIQRNSIGFSIPAANVGVEFCTATLIFVNLPFTASLS